MWGTLLFLCFLYTVGRQAMHFLRSCRGARRTRTLRSSLLRCGERPGRHPDVASGRHSRLHPRSGKRVQRGGVLRRDIRVPEAKRGRVPCRNKGEHHPSKTEKLNTKPLSRKAKGFSFVRDTGIEPVTSSVSGKRATAAPIALTKQLFCCEVRTGFEPAYTALQAAA